MTGNEIIHTALATVVQATKAKQESWIVGGSVGLMLRGLPLAAKPRDLDIYCDLEDVQNIYDSLKLYAIDEPAISVTSMYRSCLCHFIIDDVQVELVGGFQVSALGCRYVTAVRKLLLPYGARIQIRKDLDVCIVPLAHELCFNMLRGRSDRVQLIAAAIAANPSLHEGALQAIELSSHFTDEAKKELHGLITAGEEGGML
ncbi:hypothetical protein [Paenibacillus sp. sgz302251]|uniref:hypothetical protein n=1 Tax=Paenibacillus sp. sgz302251 TaxID=3414493 RepID=UPI003C7C6D8C